jgi:hypothetical protein
LSPCTPTASGCRHSARRGAAVAGDGRKGLTATGKTAPIGLTSRHGPV